MEELALKASFERCYTEFDTTNVGPPDFYWRAFVYICRLYSEWHCEQYVVVKRLS
jgi:hypothetical protein